MQDCEYLPTCSIFGRFHLDGIKSFWIKLYCQGEKQPKGQRKLIIESGRPMPQNLLPNGNYLPTND
jgi:hypothetical protein